MTERRIRVALVTGGLVPGGAERQMLLLAEGLAKAGFQVDFICLKLAGEYAERARANGAGVRVLDLKGKAESALWLPIYLLYLAWVGLRYVRMMAGRYDVVDAWLYHAYALAAVTRPLTRPRVLLSGRRSLSSFKERFGRLQRIGDAIARRATDVIVANSEAVKDDVVRREGVNPQRIRVIRNGVVIPPPMPPQTRERLRAAWGAANGTLVIGCVANYKPHKGHELLIRSMRPLIAALGHADVRLVLVGEGKHRPVLEALIAAEGVADVVVLHGGEPDASAIYGAFDIAALASEAEGLPNVVLEAAAAGLPVVATRAGGTVEVLRDDVTGLLVDVDDEIAFGAALLRLCVRPDDRTRLGAAARQDVAERFSVERMVAEFAALYTDEFRAREHR